MSLMKYGLGSAVPVFSTVIATKPVANVTNNAKPSSCGPRREARPTPMDTALPDASSDTPCSSRSSSRGADCTASCNPAIAFN